MSDDRRDERQERAAPSWVTVPTMPWTRVTPTNDDEERPTSPNASAARAVAGRGAEAAAGDPTPAAPPRPTRHTGVPACPGRPPARPAPAGAPAPAPGPPGRGPHAGAAGALRRARRRQQPGAYPPRPSPAPQSRAAHPPAPPYAPATGPGPLGQPEQPGQYGRPGTGARTGLADRVRQPAAAGRRHHRGDQRADPAGARPRPGAGRARLRRPRLAGPRVRRPGRQHQPGGAARRRRAGPGPGHTCTRRPPSRTPCTPSASCSPPGSTRPTSNPSRARLLGLRAVIVADARRSARGARRREDGAGPRRGDRRSCAASRWPRPGWPTCWSGSASSPRPTSCSPRPTRTELPDRLRATIHHYAGKCAFEQDRYIEACQHFEKALELRRDGDPELVAATEVALDALFSRVAERGWGPYPRARDEILRTHKPPAPTFDERVDRWGYQDATAAGRSPPQFADVQPFRDGVAWVRPVGIETWGLIDEAGRLLIDPRAGYLGVGSFSDGLAWVSRDGLGGWSPSTRPTGSCIQAGFDDVRPFRRGIAVVRQHGKWGAVERPAGSPCSSRSTRSPPAWPTAATSTASPTRAWPSSRWAAARASSTAPAG